MKYLVVVLIVSYSIASQSYAEEHEKIKKTWATFLNTVKHGNCTDFEKISYKQIRCYGCLENTEAEYRWLSNLRETNDKWYEILYDDKIFITPKQFCRDDLKIMFSDSFLNILKTAKTSYHYVEREGSKLYEVLVITTKPGEVHPMHEGGQHAFQFRLTDQGYKFSELSTIP